MFKKKVEFSEKDVALLEMLEAKEKLELAKQNFNYANDEYFEIANEELTIAEKRYDITIKKLKILCKDNKDIPQMQIYKSHYTF